MMNEAWEDSLGYFDMRDLLYIEAIDRVLASVHCARVCVLGRCRRHGLCLGPMVQRPGHRLPSPWKQNGEDGFRTVCMQLSNSPSRLYTLDQLLRHGPVYIKSAMNVAGLGFEDFLGNRIARSRAKRAGPDAEPWCFTPLKTEPATRQSCRASRRSRRRR